MSPFSPPATDPPDATPIPPAVRRQAAAWLVELEGDAASPGALAQWQAWRSAHADHERAWQRIVAFEQRLQTLPSPLAHATLAGPESPPRRRAMRTLGVLLCTGGTLWVAERNLPWRTWVAEHRTGTGQRQSVMLADGTRLELNVDTAIDIAYTASERLVRLVRGEILVQTAADPLAATGAPPRPFLVQTEQGRVRAIGTRFSVRQTAPSPAGESRVAVFEGQVEIRLDNADTRLLAAGQQAAFSRHAIDAPLERTQGLDAWTQGMIVAQDMPLAEFLAEVARYRPGHLACDPEVAHLPVSGTYPLADTDQILDMLRSTLPVELHAFTRYWVTVRPRQPGTAAS